MFQKARPADIPTIYPLIDVIWQDMDFPLRRLLPPERFQATMYELMQNPKTKFSYENCWVYKVDDDVCGILYGYYGKDEPAFDEQFNAFIDHRYPELAIRNYQSERETNDDEWYIDSIVVASTQRGKGIGARMLVELATAIQPHMPFGLNCDRLNPKAKAWYEKHGFQTISTVSFLGHTYDHMQKR